MEVIQIDRFFLKEMNLFQKLYEYERNKIEERTKKKIKIYLSNKWI